MHDDHEFGDHDERETVAAGLRRLDTQRAREKEQARKQRARAADASEPGTPSLRELAARVQPNGRGPWRAIFTAVLPQREVWIEKTGAVVPVASIDARYARNIIRFLDRWALRLYPDAYDGAEARERLVQEPLVLELAAKVAAAKRLGGSR